MDYSDFFKAALKASRNLININPETIGKAINSIADVAVAKSAYLLQENKKDLDKMDPQDPRYDRLRLSEDRIADIAKDIRNVVSLPNPLGKTLMEKELANGLKLTKTTVPLGVVGIVYEARPNVTFDVVALCLKTGNVAVLKGGSDAEHSNIAIISIIHEALAQQDIDANVATLLPADREATAALLNAVGYVDVLIPRGSQNLINFVRQHAKVPVIETGAGIVHAYFDETGDLEKGAAIVLNAKTRRPSVCNALDCLIVHQNRIGDLPALLHGLGERQVEIYADEPAFRELQQHYPEKLLKPATPQHFGAEFLSLKMAVKTVKNMGEALDHIANYSSKHSEAIVSEDAGHIETFLKTVDAAAVYANASTAFTDGAQFGLGAEIGISTQKLHARGPMGLEELTSYKWMVKGQGQIRE